MLKFGNVITAMVTPFYENGNIDFDEFDSLARYLLGNGSDGLLVAGTTGEGATLTEEERLRLFRFAADEYGDRTMIMANVLTIRPLLLNLPKKLRKPALTVCS